MSRHECGFTTSGLGVCNARATEAEPGPVRRRVASRHKIPSTGGTGAHARVTAVPDWLSLHGDGVTVEVKAVPRSRTTQAVGVQDGRLRVQIAAPPHDGQANAALCAYLADAAGIRAQAASIRRGSGGARKLIVLDGDPGLIAARLVDRFGAIGGGAD